MMNNSGTLYGIGVGPGDPELVTVKAANLLGRVGRVFAPKARIKAESVALKIIESYVGKEAQVTELVFPMVADQAELELKWDESATVIAECLKSGEDACFITLGDPLLYSTYIYLLRALRKIMPEARVVTVPGITAISSVAALTSFPIGEGREQVTIVPAADDLAQVRRAVEAGGTVALMKIGKRLGPVLDLLERMDAIDDAVFVSNSGMENQRVETDLRKLKGETEETGYLSTILLHSNGGKP
ncbi:MAG: precorrin-2 C(20)-methyltransferase [Nitrospinota bacterium]|nr:precorrin-2 C(20)-methyltransferase [Nitrospinota bacterium]